MSTGLLLCLPQVRDYAKAPPVYNLLETIVAGFEAKLGTCFLQYICQVFSGCNFDCDPPEGSVYYNYM